MRDRTDLRHINVFAHVSVTLALVTRINDQG